MALEILLSIHPIMNVGSKNGSNSTQKALRALDLFWIQFPWGYLIFLGINTILAYGSLGFALKYLEANKVSVIITLNPIITFILMLIFGILEVQWIVRENFTPITVIGAVMVILGTIFTVLKIRKKPKTVIIAEETSCLYE